MKCKTVLSQHSVIWKWVARGSNPQGLLFFEAHFIYDQDAEWTGRTLRWGGGWETGMGLLEVLFQTLRLGGLTTFLIFKFP